MYCTIKFKLSRGVYGKIQVVLRFPSSPRYGHGVMSYLPLYELLQTFSRILISTRKQDFEFTFNTISYTGEIWEVETAVVCRTYFYTYQFSFMYL